MISMFHLSVGDPRGRGMLFDDVTFEVPTGSWAEIVGEASCGKSLLFALLSLRATAAEGTLVVGGRNLKRARRKHVEALRRRMGASAQRPVLLTERTVLENVLVALVARGQRDGARELAEEVLERLDMSALASVRVEALTPEEQCALGVARACVGQPSMILLDGALEGLSEPRRRRAAGLLRALNADGATVVIFGRAVSGCSPGAAHELRVEDGRVEQVERVGHVVRSPEAMVGRRR